MCALRFALCSLWSKWYAYFLRPDRRPGRMGLSHYEGLRLQHNICTSTSRPIGSPSSRNGRMVSPRSVMPAFFYESHAVIVLRSETDLVGCIWSEP
jgi:hypothetical protein